MLNCYLYWYSKTCIKFNHVESKENYFSSQIPVSWIIQTNSVLSLHDFSLKVTQCTFYVVLYL